uniref:Uncharacterized protein n=1 Tax=Euplotes harpa TaxID=151035 RepID=A0A7S3N7R6_9SPIT|mmetsp:Transcript_20581/g.23770  ORF Transcript_20581/g.23770 Transcript_20581/m.23770 type:complete len:176 (+) Transcript_20581:275-802(+)
MKILFPQMSKSSKQQLINICSTLDAISHSDSADKTREIKREIPRRTSKARLRSQFVIKIQNPNQPVESSLVPSVSPLEASLLSLRKANLSCDRSLSNERNLRRVRPTATSSDFSGLKATGKRSLFERREEEKSGHTANIKLAQKLDSLVPKITRREHYRELSQKAFEYKPNIGMF